MNAAPEVPGFLAARGPAARTAPGWWLAVCVAGMSFVVLAALPGRAALAADARTRPWVERLCALAGCEVPAWNEPEAFRMQAHDVRADPARAGVLWVDAVFRNEAVVAQPWPCLRMTLTDVAGRPLASGVFAPERYGGKPGLIAPGQIANAQLQVREGSRPAAGFDFGFESCPFSETARPPR